MMHHFGDELSRLWLSCVLGDSDPGPGHYLRGAPLGQDRHLMGQDVSRQLLSIPAPRPKDKPIPPKASGADNTTVSPSPSPACSNCSGPPNQVC